MVKSLKFSEADTEKFYDSKDALYRRFWDPDGSLHWGYFENLTEAKAENFLTACQHWNDYMLSQTNITESSRVLDLGCGNGNVALWLSQKAGCEVVGVDISDVRIKNAKVKAQQYPSLRLEFTKASATNLPFEDGSFTHIWSQATLYHVHERHQAIRELHRVLKNQGTLLFDDLITPNIEDISETTRQYVYNRLMFEPIFSLESYRNFLDQTGFMVLVSQDLSPHLFKSYKLLSQLALPDYPELSEAYHKMCEAIETHQLGWGFYLCEKVSERLSWIYQDVGKQQLKRRYDAWAASYDAELNESYRLSPLRSAETLANVLPNKDALILDAGAGTGMVGEALAQLGYTHVEGIDFSETMIEVAQRKKIYRDLYKEDLENELSFLPAEKYDAVLAVGVFTFGHVYPRSLYNLSRVLKVDGYFVLTVRVDYYNSNDTLHKVLQELSWTLISQDQFNIFETEPMYLLLFQKS